ncbi:hypothetical protein P879_00399 [Paragonimus westermani]|uniref:Uncharacterized protein n=1 Tax=Paragonimus westermani TaxID=34504 RepID=A0A8T0DZ16_9TREM|nr:hypothetical protein P879_00399 [Paragonimus westermani]
MLIRPTSRMDHRETDVINTVAMAIVYKVRPPSFVTQFATAWTVLIYPVYLLLNIPLRFEAISSKEVYM